MSLVTTVLDWLTIVSNNLGTLLLAALGLAIIFGMMGIINLAHGEFIMIGVYSTAITYHADVPLPVAILVGGLVTGIVGLVLERLILQHLYDRLIDSMVATWGISLIMIQSVLIVMGPSYPGIQTPFGAVAFLDISTSGYLLFTTLAALGLLGLTYVLFMYTEVGLHARATMQNEEMARSLGVSTDRIYMLTFFYGSFVTGIAGGLFAPTITISPQVGSGYIIEAFVTVIVGGTNVLVGTLASALSLSLVSGLASELIGSLGGRVALLVTAVVIIRLLPQGLSTYIQEKQ